MKKLIISLAALVPTVAFAATINNANQLVTTLLAYGNTIMQLLIAFAVLWIIWNIIMFIVKADNPEERAIKGKAIMWGIVGLVIVFSIWGIVYLVRNSFQLQNQRPGDVPVINPAILPTL